ncbi:hypothetical protein KY343_02355 [Candidatus Woesearchaeota archaeon]|nr:hypothetical protein [Candidatus Woesearchaeota archaeon]
MKQLELEKLLEAGFYALGVEFSRRKYGEEIRVASEVDDQFEETSVKEAERKNASFKTPEGGLLAALGLYAGRDELTEDQKHVFDEAVPFFKRKAEILDGAFIVDYRVYAEETMDNYEPNADEIIRDGKILGEMIDVHLNVPGKELMLASITTYFDGYPEQEDDTFVRIVYTKEELDRIFEDNVPELVSRIDIKLKSMKGSVQKEYDPKSIYQGVMDFLV